ncbi:hypothetical protein DL95DRAFT_395180 [Leptodontidium sp. 2 PMI_412]|nr:hypothetical protein DL95DRAFT_395180 [Leptodontidium sp. 2 PMI_412]
MNADSWKLPVSIDDSQVTFDGKPLSLLYEENRRKAEDELQQRGRSREKSSRQRVKEEIHVCNHLVGGDVVGFVTLLSTLLKKSRYGFTNSLQHYEAR